MKKTNVFLFFLICTLFGYTQNNFREAYIITLDNDTVHGVINFRSDKANAEACQYKPFLDSKDLTTYVPGEINAFRFVNEGKFYMSKEITIDKTPRLVFVEYLVQGMMNLYYYKDKKQDYYFFQNEDGNITEITKKPTTYLASEIKTDSAYVNTLNYIFREHPELSNKIRDTEKRKTINFNRADFIMLTQDYHDITCTTGEECIVFANNFRQVYPRITFRPYVGIQYLEYTWESVNDRKDSKTYPLIGAQITLSLPRIIQEVALIVDLSLSKAKSKNQFTIGEGNNTIVTNIEFSSLITQFKAGLEYKYMKAKWQPFIQAGFASAFLLDISKKNYIRKFDDAGVWTEYPASGKNYKPATSFTGWYAAGGLGYQLPNRKSVFLKVSYENLNAKDKITALQVKAGYIF